MGNTSSEGPFSIAVLVYRSVQECHELVKNQNEVNDLNFGVTIGRHTFRTRIFRKNHLRCEKDAIFKTGDL